MKNKHFGEHLMLDLYGIPNEQLGNYEAIKKMLIEVPNKIGMRLLTQPFVSYVQPQNEKDNGGITGFVILVESHFSVHTFLDRGFATLDLYSCKNDMNVEGALEEIKKCFTFTKMEKYFQKRGKSFEM